MLMSASMLESAATAAGIKMPQDPDKNFAKTEYPHFHILCVTQLHRPMVHGEHFENAKKIAALSLDQIKTMKFPDYVELGVYPEGEE